MEDKQLTAKCVAKTVRITSRKARLVADLVRGKKVTDAIAILRLTPRAASPLIEKVVVSASANAVNNLNMAKEKLYIKEIYVNEGMTMKRYLPRAKGSADRLLKRTSHITVVVAEKE